MILFISHTTASDFLLQFTPYPFFSRLDIMSKHKYDCIFPSATFGHFVQTHPLSLSFPSHVWTLCPNAPFFVPFSIDFDAHLWHIKSTFSLSISALQDTHPVSTRMHIKGLSLDVLARENSLEPFFYFAVHTISCHEVVITDRKTHHLKFSGMPTFSKYSCLAFSLSSGVPAVL